jgi:signal transduction histidine kinase
MSAATLPPRPLAGARRRLYAGPWPARAGRWNQLVTSPSLLTRAAFRTLAGGLLAGLAVAASGVALERLQFGATDHDAFLRVERDVQAQLEETAVSLRTVARALAARPELLAAAAADRDAELVLFDAVDRAIQAEPEPLAVTVYSVPRLPLAIPVAWGGRPSEAPPADRLAGPAAVFAAPGPLGLRLVHVEPVIDPSAGGRRLGVVVSERLISTRARMGNPAASTFTAAATLAPVELRTPYEGAGETVSPDAFVVRSPHGEILVEGHVSTADLRVARAAWRRGVGALLLGVLAVTLLLLLAPALDWRDRQRHGSYLRVTAAVVGLAAAAWFVTSAAAHVEWPTGPHASAAIASSEAFPFDLFLAGLLAIGLVGVAFDLEERWRREGRTRRRDPRGAGLWPFVLVHFGALVALSLVAYQVFLRTAFAASALDPLHFSVHPWNTRRITLAFGLLLCHAAVLWADFLLFRLASARWRVGHSASRNAWLLAAWLAPFGVVYAGGRMLHADVPWQPTAIAYLSVVATGFVAPRVLNPYRHGSQGFRLILSFVALLVPALVIYPSLVHYAAAAKRQLVETRFGPQVIDQRNELKARLDRSTEEIDGIPGLSDLVLAASPPAGGAPSSDIAFRIWSQTDLAAFRLASAIEVYGGDGMMVSRFALNLPEYTSTAQKWWETSCSRWDKFEEVSPFGSEERRLLHAGRRICRPAPEREPPPHGGPARPAPVAVVGAIVIHVMLDYDTLPFISSQSPYFELFRAKTPPSGESAAGSDVDFMVYGWGRVPIYTSGPIAWPLDDQTFSRAYRDPARRPFWTAVETGGRRYELYVLNDRAGIYVLGYPALTAVGHLVNLAELATLVGILYVTVLFAVMLFALVTGRRPAPGRALLREIRASFYRKLFLAFVAVAVVPVLTLAFVTRAYIAARLLNDVRSAAVKTTAVAQRVIEDYGTLQQRGTGTWQTEAEGRFSRLDDDIMVWISRVIDQDVNIFEAARLVATSERDLFASGLLPTRIAADVYRAIVLKRLPSYVGEEQVGEGRYMLASAPVRAGDREAVLTVPLTLRQQEIEREIDDLNRRIVLAALAFILVGAAIGYVMAERIGDPVNRLTRATDRIARGEFDARIAATSSDELRRLVEAFNRMAAELERQRAQLERTHRLEAWAEMARQVAHEIKNPLTPIQLSAEHLRRVHSDRGRPLTPVLDECIDSILTQVRLLRQISAEFSSYASAPVPRPAATDVAELVDEVIRPYRSGLAGRVEVVVDMAPEIPALVIDRTLVGRALTNMVENALHAMPGTGRLTVAARLDAERRPAAVAISITDTGVGMDADTLGRLFEPYFSTKAVGTGLGLAIAKRNVEVNGGTIAVASQKGVGTTVTISFPAVRGPEAYQV